MDLLEVESRRLPVAGMSGFEEGIAWPALPALLETMAPRYWVQVLVLVLVVSQRWWMAF